MLLCFKYKANLARETKLQPVTIISLWFHVASDWLLRNEKCQNQIKVIKDKFELSITVIVSNSSHLFATNTLS